MGGPEELLLLGCGFVVVMAIAIGVFVVIAIAAVKQFNRRGPPKRDEIPLEPPEDDDRKRAEGYTQLWLDLKERYPYLRTPKLENPTSEAILAAIVAEVNEHGKPYGKEIDSGLSVPALPEKYRLRHMWVVGRTGSGKTTFLEHQIQSDLTNAVGVGVVAPEGELFTERLLPMLTDLEERLELSLDLVYFAPGDTTNNLTLNPLSIEPGTDPIRAAEDMYTIFRRLFGEEGLGARMQPILQNAFGALVGRPGATLTDVKRLLTDEAFRYEVSTSVADEYVREFWRDTYPRFPRGTDLPILNRLDRFLRPQAIRKTLCVPESSFSIRDVLAQPKILFVNLFGLSEENRLLIGQVLVSKLQLELMRRELSASAKTTPFFLYIDEFQSIAGVSVGTWRELLSRARKYNLGLTLGNQYPGQLPTELQGELFGNVGSLVSFGLGGKDAATFRRDFIHEIDGKPQPIPATALVELGIGEAYARLGGGRAAHFQATPPLELVSNAALTRDIVARSRASYAPRDTPKEPLAEPEMPPTDPQKPDDFYS